MKIIRVQFKSDAHREKFAAVAAYNRVFANYMPAEFYASYDANRMFEFKVVDFQGSVVELPDHEGGGSIIFDEEEFNLFMKEIK
ncbi:hypothetical protein UGMREWDR_CDS0074 [Aeromonas phage GomatiRiver_11]|nr:hypothetical protein OBDJBBDK_00068 [Aeromonas phage AhFM11]WKW84241.1 hypothetical protein UGMREWDR_CDS0074 [Aeromonas phage GomatiRiver_11]